MIPFLLYVPPLLGVGRFDVKTVAAITMVQVLVAAVSGVVAHGRHRAVNPRLAWIGGLTMAVGSLAGAVASKHVPHRVLLIVFALMVTAAFALLVALGALPGAQLGVLASQRLSGVALKRILFLVIVLTGVRVWWDVLVD